MAKLYKTFFCFYLLPSIILQYEYSYTYMFDKWLGIEKVFNDSLPYVGFFVLFDQLYLRFRLLYKKYWFTYIFNVFLIIF